MAFSDCIDNCHGRLGSTVRAAAGGIDGYLQRRDGCLDEVWSAYGWHEDGRGGSSMGSIMLQDSEMVSEVVPLAY